MYMPRSAAPVDSSAQSGYMPKSAVIAKPKKQNGNFLDNVVNSTGQLIGDTFSAIAHPINTAKSIYGLGSGILQLAIPGEQGNEELARSVGKFYADRYGSLDKAFNTFYNDPAGMLMDASVVLGGAGGLLKTGAGLATKGAKVTSLASNAAKAGRIGSKLSKVASYVDPISLAGKGVGRGFNTAKGKLASGLASESENILTRGMGNPMGLKKARGVSPISMNELFAKYNTYDRSPESFQAGASTANKQARSLLESAPTSIDTRNIVKLFDEEIAKLADKAKTSTKNRLAMEELINRKQMFLDGIQSPEMATPLFNDATKVYDIKSSFQGDVPPSSFGMPTQEVGKNLGTTKAYQTLLSGVEQKAPGIKNLGREQAALLKLKEIATNQANRGAAKQNMNFSRLGGAGLGGFLGGIPGAVGGYAIEQVANSPQFLAGSSKAMGLGARGLNTSVPIPNLLRQGLGAGYNTAKVGRMASPTQSRSESVQRSPVGQPLVREKRSYTPSVSQPRFVTTQINYKAPANPFKNKSSFGKTKKVRAGSFN
jgi:hypothetical protein